MSQVMTRYISNPDNLKLMMNMLKEKSRNIQFEAFHVFKVLIIYFALQFSNIAIVIPDINICFNCINRFSLQIQTNQNLYLIYFLETKTNWLNSLPNFTQIDQKTSNSMMKKPTSLNKSKN